MKEMIKALIADGWEWVCFDKEKESSVFVFKNKPYFDEEFGFQDEKGFFWELPRIFFPDITFENSPIELKTLLVEDEESEEQDFIRQQTVKESYEKALEQIKELKDFEILQIKKKVMRAEINRIDASAEISLVYKHYNKEISSLENKIEKWESLENKGV